MSDPIFLTMTGEHHGLVSAGCGSKPSIGRYAHINHEDQIFALSLLSGWGYEQHSERRCISFHKFIDKSTPLLALGINENERYFLEFDFYRINQFGHFEKYYFIELRGASMIALQMNFDTRSGHDTECVTLAYDYIRCRHLIAATEYYHFALPANYNSLFSVQNSIVAARNAAQRSVPKVNVSKPFGIVKTPAPAITPVFAKSCLRGAGCTDAGTSEEPAENFGQMAIFAQPMLGGGLLAAQDAFARMTQVWGRWSLSGSLGVARGIPYVGVLASALYIPSAGEGSDRPPGQREFWHGDELRRKANTVMKATTRVRFFWRPDSQGQMQVYGVHTGEGTPYEGVRVALMKWAEENRRYEFTPAGSVDGPLITWTPEKQAGAVGPSHTGHDVKPIDQATILVTPIPTGEDEYTTPAFPVPHERDLNDYILVFPADAGMEPIYVYLSEGKDRVPVIDDVVENNYLKLDEKVEQQQLEKLTANEIASLKQNVTNVRAGLPSAPKRAGNVAVAEIDIPGMPKTMAAHSRVNNVGKGLVGKGSQNFEYQTLPNKEGVQIPRNTDSEYKILDNLADKLGTNTSAKGTVTILTERPACSSCLGVVEQFQQKYPDIQVNVVDNKGILLTPRKN